MPLIRCLVTITIIAVPLPSDILEAQDATPVGVARVTEAEVKSGHRVVGTVHPLRTSTVGSAVDGRVAEFLVNQGDPVLKGQVLAQLLTETLEIERAAAQAEHDLSRHRLAELENGSRAEDIAEAEANMRSARASLKNAESRLKRTESLALTGAATQADLDDAVERAEAARFAYQATESILKRIQDGPRHEMIAQAKSQMELQRQRLNLINDRIAKSAIRAPFDGFVSSEFTETGSWITRGDPIAEIIQLDEVEIRVPVTAEAVVSLRKGDVVRIEVPALPDELLTGSIDRIVPVAEAGPRTFPVHLKLKNSFTQGAPMLMAGMLVRIDLPAGKRETLPLVPKDALVLNGDDRSVYVVSDLAGGAGEGTGIVRKINVDLGVAVADRIQVRGNVNVDDLVVVVGNERLLPDSPVKIVRNPKSDTLE